MPATPPIRYRSPEEDSARWLSFTRRPGDIVISTRSKSGTTWMQMICALLIFQGPALPAPLAELSPWIDWLVLPEDELFARLATQDHRRVVKTHTPLDGIPLDPDVMYIVVARHPLDMAVSLYHQGDNLDRARIRALTGQPEPQGPSPARPPLHEWLVDWIDWECDWRALLDSIPGIMGHVGDAWARRDEPNIRLVHYADLTTDLDTEMRRIAAGLAIPVDETGWPSLVGAAGFDAMRTNAETLAPDTTRVLKDRAAFFREGRCGRGAEILTPGELARYHERVAALGPPDLVHWLHHGATA